jgi:hypothetical protein
MKKPLRIVAIVFGSFIGLVLLAAVIIPLVFKDEINAEVKKTINHNVRAKVDYTNVSLSILRNFPYLSVGLEGLEVVGVDDFAGDTLARVGRFDLAVNLLSVISGEKMDVKKVLLKDAYLHIIVLPDGKANYDIAIPDSAKPDTAKGPSKFALKLSKYSLENVNLIYDDQKGNMYVQLTELNHTGSGDLTADVYDLSTETQIRELLVRMDGSTYANKLKIGADIDLIINMAEKKYTLSRGDLAVNELKLKLTGVVATPANEVQTDVKFEAAETGFRNILSLVPSIYTKDFNDLKTDGTLALNGFVRGTYAENRMPAFGLNLLVKNGSFQYPDLPTPVTNVNIDLAVNSPENDVNHMNVNLKKFHADLGPNPVDARVLLTSIKPMNIDGTLNAQLDLENVTRIFPLPDMEVKGKLAVNATATGVYYDKTYPAIQATLDLRQGYLKTKEFPAAIENVNIQGKVANATGRMEDMRIDLTNLHLEVDKEPIDGRLAVENLDDPTYDVKLKGRLDLAKLTKIYPIEGTELAGLVNADIATQGRLSSVKGKQYDKLPTTGSMTIRNLVYKSTALKAPIKVSNAELSFTPAYLELSQMTGTAGQSDFSMSGRVLNYIGYAIKGDTLRANLSLNSKSLNLNEWLSGAPSKPEQKDTAPLVAPSVPANLNVSFLTSIGEINYDKYLLQNVSGGVRIVNQKVQLQNLLFTLLGGNFATTGSYATKTKDHPEIDLSFDVQKLDIQKAQAAFPIIQKYLPIAQNAYGTLSTKLNIAGRLTRNMALEYEKLNGNGRLELAGLELRNVSVLNKLAELTRMNDLKNPKLNTISVQFEIKNGRIYLKPFDIQYKDYKATISGSNGLDKTLDYDLKLDVPTGPIGTAAANAISGLLKTKLEAPKRVVLNFGITGSVNAPKVVPKGASGGTTGATGGVGGAITDQVNDLKKQAEDRARAEADKLKTEAEARARAEADKLKTEAEARARAEADRLKKEAEAKARSEAERLRREAEERAKKLFRF